MSQTRRSILTSLNDEQKRFLATEPARPAVSTLTTDQPPMRGLPPAKPAVVEAKPEPEPITDKASKLTRKQTSAQPAPLVQANFRLPQNLMVALTMAAASRKTQKLQPYTQQDIMAAAIELWLKKNGHSMEG